MSVCSPYVTCGVCRPDPASEDKLDNLRFDRPNIGVLVIRMWFWNMVLGYTTL